MQSLTGFVVKAFFAPIFGGKDKFMIENTISIDSTDVLNSKKELFADETEVQKIEASNAEEKTEDYGYGTEKSENSAQEESGADQPEMMLELNVYGNKMQVPVSRAVAAAQKGIAFEHIKAQLADAKNDVRLKTLETLAAQSGKTVSALVLDMHTDAVTNDLVARYGSIADVPYDEVAKAVMSIENCRAQLQQGDVLAQKNSWRTQLAEFVENNPGCTDIPPDVIEAAKQGENISRAYSRLYDSRLTEELNEAKREIDILKSQQKSEKTSTPSAAGTASAGKTKENEFLKIMKSTW